MFNDDPKLFLGSTYSENGTVLSIPLAAFPELTADEADASTGDIRKIIYALLAQFNAVFAATPEEDRPGKMTISRSAGSVNVAGVFPVTFTVAFEVSAVGVDVVEE